MFLRLGGHLCDEIFADEFLLHEQAENIGFKQFLNDVCLQQCIKSEATCDNPAVCRRYNRILCPRCGGSGGAAVLSIQR